MKIAIVMTKTKTLTKMNLSRNNHRYSQLSSRAELLAEKGRLLRKIKRQEKRLAQDWKRIEKSWQIFGKIGKIFSSSLLVKSISWGYKLFANFFSGFPFKQ